MLIASEEVFKKYEEIRQSGKYNMITDCLKVMEEMNVSIGIYTNIITNYNEYYQKNT